MYGFPNGSPTKEGQEARQSLDLPPDDPHRSTTNEGQRQVRTIRPNLDAFSQCRGSKTLHSFSEELGVSIATLHRVLAGKAEPGPRFIAAVLDSQPYSFDHFFKVVDRG